MLALLFRAPGCGCSVHPAFPAPSFFGRTVFAQLGHRAAGSRSRICDQDAVIASEAKQPISPRKERTDCFVAALLAMTLCDRTLFGCLTIESGILHRTASSRLDLHAADQRG
jgi:hypothetical protein